MTGQALSYIEAIKDFAARGLSYDEAADQLNLCCPYVARLAKTHGIVFAQKRRDFPFADQIRELAGNGVSRRETAKRLNLTYEVVSRIARNLEIPFVHDGAQVAPTVRTRQMAALYKSGKTLQEIGDQYGITRERVRQLITKYHGLRRPDGGQHRTGEINKSIRDAKRNAASLKRWGCNFDQYVELRNMRKPTRAFSTQRRNAKTREIGFELNLWQWWSIWRQSGKWTLRGRGSGYLMCRFNDVGPYAIGNVYIGTGCENSSREYAKTSGLPRGVCVKKRSFVARRCINGKKLYLGSHPTPELAHAAYLAAGPAQ